LAKNQLDLFPISTRVHWKAKEPLGYIVHKKKKLKVEGIENHSAPLLIEKFFVQKCAF
jgi:hypothetical protein